MMSNKLLSLALVATIGLTTATPVLAESVKAQVRKEVKEDEDNLLWGCDAALWVAIGLIAEIIKSTENRKKSDRGKAYDGGNGTHYSKCRSIVTDEFWLNKTTEHHFVNITKEDS